MKLIILNCILIGAINANHSPHAMWGGMESIDIEDKFYPTSKEMLKTCRSEASMGATKSKCQPRPRLVRITSSSPQDTVYPAMVEVNRCEGSCGYSGHTCMAASTEIRKVSVNIFKISSNSLSKTGSCGVIPVEEHTSCSCGCPLGPKHCSSLQEFVKESCSCRCINREELKQRCHEMSRIWNDFDCTCRCPEELVCSTGAIFVHEMCKCMRYM